MADGGARLFIVGFESGDPQILKNIKKGATVEMAREFMKNCKKVGIRIHGDFIIGLPGETRETIQHTIDFAKELDCETIQVSLAHAYARHRAPRSMAKKASSRSKPSPTPAATSCLTSNIRTCRKNDGGGQSLLRRYYFRPRVVWRIVREALWDAHERKRLYHEATEFLKLRSERWKYAKRRRRVPKRSVRTENVCSADLDGPFQLDRKCALE